MKIYARRHHADAPEEFGVGAAVHEHAHILLRLILNLFFDIREDRLERGKPYRFQERRPQPTTWCQTPLLVDAGFRVVLPDLFGFGQSDDLPDSGWMPIQ